MAESAEDCVLCDRAAVALAIWLMPTSRLQLLGK